jgi:hypothetical protein
MIAQLDCEGGNCPASYVTDRRSVPVQGDRTGVVGQVRVPESLVRQHQMAGEAAWPAAGVSPAEPGYILVTGATVDDAEALAFIRPADHESVVELFGGSA